MDFIARGANFLRRVRRRLSSGGRGGAVPAAAEPPYQFASGGREIWTPTPEPPYPFQNVLYNDAYYTLIDQCARGSGRHMSAEGYINNVIENERHVYVRDDATGEFFLIDFAPVYHPCERFRCTAGLNYQLIEQRALGLEATWRIYVPAGADPLEVWDVRLRDLTGRSRQISLFAHVWMKCDGMDLYVGEMARIAQYAPEAQALFVRMDAAHYYEIDFPRHNGFMTSWPAPTSWDANPGSFLGPRRTLASPLAVEQGRCGGSRMAMWPPIAALQVGLEIPGGGEGEARFLVGACDHEADIQQFRRKYLGGTLAADPHFTAMLAGQERITANLHLETPEPQLNLMLNTWVQKQIHHGAQWGRWGFKGYRDALQQAVGVATIDPAQARRNILDCCRHQYADGFALRGWRPVDTKRYADSAQWLIHATTEYLKETGDWGVLEERVPYFDQGTGDNCGLRIADCGLMDSQNPQSAIRNPHSDGGTVWEHLVRAMERLHEDRGPHGLCLAWGGDWNDSLTGVCRHGQGESVWLSMAYCRCALLLAELADECGMRNAECGIEESSNVQCPMSNVWEEALEKADSGLASVAGVADETSALPVFIPHSAFRIPHSEFAAQMRAWHSEMAGAINTHGWDGEWWRCALDDDGNPIGSAACEEGKIFLILQAWAVWGRVASDERWRSAWAAVRQHLDTGWGFRLVWPSYTKYVPGVGRLSTIRPGTTENGSVYTHGNAFMVVALLERGMPDEALALWRALAPGNPARPLCQPNVFFSGYYGPDSEVLPGLPDHAWMTGSAAWMFHAATELLLGVRRTYRGLVIRPCLPGGWPGARVTRCYRGTVYKIKIENPGAVTAAAVAQITVDGCPHPAGEPLPVDGGEHEVVIVLNGVAGSWKGEG